MPDKDYHHGDLRAALVLAALERLEAGGAAALSLRGIARDCGVSAMAPYRHFADKDALLDAVAGHGFQELARCLEEADATAGGREPSPRRAPPTSPSPADTRPCSG
ncbi:TetR/AcrR family transcriptional regulator [Methylobacterium persicinum]